jgi:hypothetical protein
MARIFGALAEPSLKMRFRAFRTRSEAEAWLAKPRARDNVEETELPRRGSGSLPG